MRFAFTEQQLELRHAVHQVLERECTVGDLRALMAPGHKHGDPGRSAERWRVLSELGATGLLVPDDRGGLGLSALELVGVLEEAGWYDLPEPLAESAGLAAPLLAECGDPTWVERVAGGELVATVGGIDVRATGPVCATSGALGHCITGRVAGAARADLFVLARRDQQGAMALHALARGDVAVELTPTLDATRDLGTVTWAPGGETLLAAGAEAEALVAALADRAAAFSAAQLLGLADRMITMGADYARERHQFGRPIGSFQAVKHLLADARVRLEFARPATYRAADSIARALPGRAHDASMAKALASDAADLAARVALQVHGAIGYTWECDLHLWMKRAWALSGAWGDADTHRALVLTAARERLAR